MTEAPIPPLRKVGLAWTAVCLVIALALPVTYLAVPILVVVAAAGGGICFYLTRG